MKVTLTHDLTGLTNVFEDLYIWEIVRTNLQYDAELDDYTIVYEDVDIRKYKLENNEEIK